jgi:hypothetical protein
MLLRVWAVVAYSLRNGTSGRKIEEPPFLGRQHIEDSYVPSIKLVGSRLCEKWEGLMAKDDAVTINNDLLSATMYITSLISCGQDLNSIMNGNTQLGEHIRYLFHFGILRS